MQLEFKTIPISTFRCSSNLQNYLVRAKLHDPTAQKNQLRASYRCGNNCSTCTYITDGQTSYTFHATGETRHITHNINCNSKNVFYMVQTSTADQSTNQPTSPSLPQFQNTSSLIITPPTTFRLFHSSSFIPIVTVYAKQEKHIS